MTSTTDEPIAAQMSASGTVRFAGTLAGLDGATLMEVVVSGPADALPEGTTMSLAAVADAEVEDAVRAAVGERRFARVSAIQSVDITFRDPQGNEVEPTRALEVTLRSPLVAESADLMVVLSFKAARFSTYCLVLVGEETGEATDGPGAETATLDGSAARTLVAGDGSYRITVTCPAEAHVPAGAKLEVSELREASRAYVSYVGRVSDKLAEGADVSYARLFDISITVDGEKIQPDAPVAVRIELLDEEGPAVADDEELVVAHFAEESPRVPDTVQAQVEGEGADSTVSFEADSFSIYAIVVTHIEKNVLAADGNTYHITVSYTPDAAIPESTELEVYEVAEESGAYARYLAKASEALGDDLEPSFARFFDISLKKDGTQVQPAAPVSVTVELADASGGAGTAGVYVTGAILVAAGILALVLRKRTT